MAAQIPVTIDSSPPNDAYRIPSITPDGIRQGARTEFLPPSSPRLLSPSAFVRPRTQALKSGSRAQKVPTGANAGFSTAASIWKLQSNDQDIQSHRGLHGDETVAVEDKPESEKRKTRTKASGKLSRLKRTTKAQKDTSSTPRDAQEHPPAQVDASQQPAIGAAIEIPESHKDPDARYSNILDPNFPYTNPVEQSSDTVATSVKHNAPSTELPLTNQLRKRAPTDYLPGEKPAPKKPRKSQTKSEAIVLDSDEPEITLDEAQADDGRAAKKPNNPRPAESSPKPVRTLSTRSSKPNAIAVHTREATEITESVPLSVKHSAETSAYFAQQEPAVPLDQPSPSFPPMAVEQLDNLKAIGSVCVDDVVEKSEVNNVQHVPGPAPRRRRSWTPTQDSHGEYSAHSIPTLDCSLDDRIGHIEFSEMLGNFSYLDPKAVAAPDPASDNGIKKSTVTAAENRRPTISKPTTESRAKPASKKKPKAPKKPQTITSLATAAYQPMLQAETAQSTVSEFFAPRKEREISMANGAGEHEKAVEEPAKAKKPRKSRAKAETAEGDLATTKKQSKSRTKTKNKVKFNPADHQPPLYSPTQARRQMRSQEFLFGTSSQLAAEESPDFIREVQHAIRQSETTSGLPDGSQVFTQVEVSPQSVEKSYSRVPTAPHGTCLSVEQATRELWCASARDETGSKLIQEAKDKSDDNALAQAQLDMSPMGRPELPQESPIDLCNGRSSNLPPGESAASPLESVDQKEGIDASREQAEKPALVAQSSVHEERCAPQGTEWVFLPSDDSELLPHDPIPKSGNQPAAYTSLGSMNRPALQPLDANLKISIHDLGTKSPTRLERRPFSTAAVTSERHRPSLQPLKPADDLPLVAPKRGRGRPRKEGSADRAPLTSPARGRGQPRKQSLTGSASKTSPVRPRGRPRKEHSTEKETTPKRPVGRPRKHPISTTPPPKPSKERSPQHSISASQLASRKEWTNIDDISDSDSPKTPSPRRRRASSTPPLVRPLHFEGRQSPSAKSKGSTSSGGMKATDTEWPAVQAVIYPEIAQTIKSTPPSTDLKDPSWLEKILLYHPIVLEDLTAWLNTQGLRTHVQRLKPKVKQRGRKRKDAPPEVDEWETIEDELKAWMVQKWCEDHSICCLWKDGLRGGVKARY